MKRFTAFVMLLMTNTLYGQVTDDADGLFDSTTYVETNGTTTSASTVTSNNTNNNNNVNTSTSTSTSTSTNTNNNNNVNTSTSTSTNTNTNTNTNYNVLSGGTTNTNTNNNNNVNTTTSTNTNTNTNTNINTSTSTSNNTNNNNNVNNTTINATNTNNNTNTNVNTSTSNNTNTNVSTVESNSTAVNTNNNNNNTTSDNTNTNNNFSESVSTSESVATNNNNNVNENRNTSVSESTQTQNINQKIESPPPSAIAPSIGSSYSQDLCTTGISGAVQTQIFGISGGKSITDTNCERIKLSKTLYDMGMRVAAVSLMCQDDRVYMAMRMAGTPCPFEGLIGDDAKDAWTRNPQRVPDGVDLPEQGKLDDDLQVWSKSDFCEAYPREDICKDNG